MLQTRCESENKGHELRLLIFAFNFMRNFLLFICPFFAVSSCDAQADNEIQVYASPTIQHKWTIFELHSNYTFQGSKLLSTPKMPTGQTKPLRSPTVSGKILRLVFIHFQVLHQAVVFNISATR